MEKTIDLLLLFSWVYMLAGPLTGAYMATWAYEGEKSTTFFGDYTAEPRRIYRVAHINCFVFPYMGIMWALAVERTQLFPGLVSWGVAFMMLATVFMTLPLFASLKWHGLRNATVVGLVALLGGIGILVYAYASKLWGA